MLWFICHYGATVTLLQTWKVATLSGLHPTSTSRSVAIIRNSMVICSSKSYRVAHRIMERFLVKPTTIHICQNDCIYIESNILMTKCVQSVLLQDMSIPVASYPNRKLIYLATNGASTY